MGEVTYMEELLECLLEECRPYTKIGKLADYIPELTKADINDLGIYVISSDGKKFRAGDFDKKFTIQSIVKPLLLLLALTDKGIETIRQYIGVEATGKPFNAIDYSEHSILREHINPMVNIGAIEMCSMIHGESCAERFDRLLDFTRTLAGNPEIDVDEAVFLSEKRTGNKNRALAYLLKSSGMIEGDVEELLDMYFRACSIRISCQDLANIGFVLANHGRQTVDGEKIFPARFARFVNAILTTCGMYDGSGDFAIKVGLPAKSGVGGGIMAIAPTRMGIGIYSPGLDAKGNSVAGIRLLEQLSGQLYLSMF